MFWLKVGLPFCHKHSWKCSDVLSKNPEISGLQSQTAVNAWQPPHHTEYSNFQPETGVSYSVLHNMHTRLYLITENFYCMMTRIWVTDTDFSTRHLNQRHSFLYSFLLFFVIIVLFLLLLMSFSFSLISVK